MSAASTVAQTQDRAFNPWMLSKFPSAMVKTASLALGEIPSVPEQVRPRTGHGAYRVPVDCSGCKRCMAEQPPATGTFTGSLPSNFLYSQSSGGSSSAIRLVHPGIISGDEPRHLTNRRTREGRSELPFPALSDVLGN